MSDALNAVLASENPLVIILALAILAAIIGAAFIGYSVVKWLSQIVPLVAKLVTTLHELSDRIGDQLDALKQIDDGTKERTQKGVAVILEHSERAFAALRKQADDNHAAAIEAINRLRLDMTMQLNNQQRVKSYSEKDKET